MATPFRELRLTHSKAIRAVFQSGKRLRDPHLRLVFRPTELDHPRLCIQVGRKISKKAVVRNRIRRRTREAFNEPLSTCPRGFDIVVMAQHTVAEMPWHELTALSQRLLEKALTR